MAVVLKVPTEVLTEIFHLLCTKSIFISKLSNWCYKEDFPWAVGLVCRQWRTVFLSYPPIWATLTLSDPDIVGTRSEPYAKEINRRLALYLERSGRYPLRLDIRLRSKHNKTFTMMALEMLSACSHRWQTAKFKLFCDWPGSILLCKGQLPILECLEIRGSLPPKHARGIFEGAPRLTHVYIGCWAKSVGWILPWTQLTELILTFDGWFGFVIKNGDVQNLLPMLHNIKELRFRFDESDFEGGIPQFAPTPLNQLRVLEVSHPAIISWFKAPSLCEICFVDFWQYYDEPLDVHAQISSLIQRSSCRIRKLSFTSGRNIYVGTLKDVEELVVDYRFSYYGVRSSIDISSLLNLRLLTIIFSVDQHFESSVDSLTTSLKSARVPTRSGYSSGTPISLLERATVELHYGQEEPEIPQRLLEITDEWPVVVFRTQRS